MYIKSRDRHYLVGFFIKKILWKKRINVRENKAYFCSTENLIDLCLR